MEVILILIAIGAFVCFFANISESNDKKKENERQAQILSTAKNRLRDGCYIEQGSFNDGWSLVKLHDFHYAFIDRNNRSLNNDIYFYATPFKNGTAIVGKSGGGYGIVRKDGTYAIPFIAIPNQLETYIKEIWDDIFLYSKNYYKKPSYVERTEKFIVKRDGSYILNQPIDEILEIKSDYIKIRIGKRIGEVNFQGNFLSRPFRTKVDLGNGLYRIRDVEFGWGIYDSKIDDIIIPCKYSEILYFQPYDIFILKPFGDGHRSFPCFVVNRKNEIIIPAKYDEISILEHRFIQVSNYNHKRGLGLLSGIIDLGDNELVRPLYSHIWLAKHGFMVAESDGRCGRISQNGISNLEYDSYEMVCLTKWDCSSIRYGRSSFGKGSNEVPYMESFSCKPSYLIVSKNGKFGVVDLDNQVVIPLIYDSISSIDNSINVPGYYLVEKSAKFGVLDINGKNVIPFNYTQIIPHREGENDFVWKSEVFDERDNDLDILQRINEESEEYDRYLDSIKGKQLYFECKDQYRNTYYLNTIGKEYVAKIQKKLGSSEISMKNRAFDTKCSDYDEKPNKVNHNSSIKQYLFFDTETTGIPNNYNAPSSDIDNWPRLVQIAWVVADDQGNIIKGPYCEIIRPINFTIPVDAVRVHGITNSLASKEGKDLTEILSRFNSDVEECSIIVGHNISFDVHIVAAELFRLGNYNHRKVLESKPMFCTMKSTVNFCKIPGRYGYKYPKLNELYFRLFGGQFDNAHDASADILATLKCYFELKRKNEL